MVEQELWFWLHKVISWNQTLCKEKKNWMSQLATISLEIGLENAQIQGSIRKHVSYQIHKWKKCNLGEMKIPIPNQKLWGLNAYYSWGRKPEVNRLTLVSAESTAHNIWDSHKENPPLLMMRLQLKIQTIHEN